MESKASALGRESFRLMPKAKALDSKNLMLYKRIKYNINLTI